jgi:hypothetical protein
MILQQKAMNAMVSEARKYLRRHNIDIKIEINNI